MNVETKTILNYMAIVDFPNLSLISMLSGPQAMFAGEYRETNALLEEEGFRSQEVFTQEKYVYLYYQGLRLLEHLYDNGISHGHISAKTLRISDSYTFSLSDFMLSNYMPTFKDLPE